MVDAEGVQHGGMQIADVDDIFNCVVTEFIGCAVADAPLTPPPASQTENPLMW